MRALNTAATSCSDTPLAAATLARRAVGNLSVFGMKTFRFDFLTIILLALWVLTTA